MYCRHPMDNDHDSHSVSYLMGSKVTCQSYSSPELLMTYVAHTFRVCWSCSAIFYLKGYEFRPGRRVNSRGLALEANSGISTLGFKEVVRSLLPSFLQLVALKSHSTTTDCTAPSGCLNSYSFPHV